MNLLLDSVLVSVTCLPLELTDVIFRQYDDKFWNQKKIFLDNSQMVEAQLNKQY